MKKKVDTEGLLINDVYGYDMEKALRIDRRYLGAFVGMRIEEVSVKEWESIHKKTYTLSGDPTIGIYGVRLKWNYNYSQTLIPFDRNLTRKQAEEFCKEFNKFFKAARG